MEKKRLEHFKKVLEERQQKLRRTASRNAQDGRDADLESAQDIADRAASSYNKEFLFHQSDDNRRILQLVSEALQRLNNGGYGLCVACHDEVQAKRLDAVPWARHCLECQQKQEQGLL